MNVCMYTQVHIFNVIWCIMYTYTHITYRCAHQHVILHVGTWYYMHNSCMYQNKVFSVWTVTMTTYTTLIFIMMVFFLA